MLRMRLRGPPVDVPAGLSHRSLSLSSRTNDPSVDTATTWGIGFRRWGAARAFTKDTRLSLIEKSDSLPFVLRMRLRGRLWTARSSLPDRGHGHGDVGIRVSRVGRRARVHEGYESVSHRVRTLPFVLRMRLRGRPDTRGSLRQVCHGRGEERLPYLFAKFIMYVLLPCAESER